MTVLWSADDPIDISSLLALVARQLDLRIAEIVREMRDLLASQIADLGGDPSLVEMLQASIEGNVTTICHILANDIDLGSLQPTTAAVEYAARLAQRDVPMSALTRAYYLGQSMFLRLAMDEVERLGIPDGIKIEVVRGVADVVHRYIDWILQLVTEVHDQERRRWWNTRATVNAGVILKVIRGDTLPLRSFESETGYSLNQRHLGLVVWSDNDVDDPEQQQRIDRLVRQSAHLAGSNKAPLITAADRSTAWAWIASPVLSSDAVRAIAALAGESTGSRIALGTVLDGVAGFRRTHDQAVTARLVALSSPRYRAQALVDYSDSDVALAALFTKDPQITATWVREVLGPLSGPGEENRVARQTLAAFYAAGENTVRAAEILGVHRNTVRQRLAKIQGDRMELRGDALHIALAVRIVDDLDPDRIGRSEQPL